MCSHLRRQSNAVVLTEDHKQAFVWNHENKSWNQCKIYGQINDVAICHSDDRFAAGFSDQRVREFEVNYYKGKRRARANKILNQKVLRIWHTKTGDMLIRLATGNKSLRAIRFFTNQVAVAGFTSDGLILLWKLQITMDHGKEKGQWPEKPVILKNNGQIPLECVFTGDGDFISVYDDGSIVKRRKSGEIVSHIQTLPGIDFSALKMDHVKMDGEVEKYLNSYKQLPHH